MKNQGLLDQIQRHWQDNGWDLRDLYGFRMETPDPSNPPLETPPGDVIQIPVEVPDPEPPAAANGNGKTGRTFSEADIAKARQEEKDKLYPRLQTMEEELKAMRKMREDEDKARKDAAKAAEAEMKKKAEEEMSAKELLAQKEKEWNDQLASIRAEQERDRAMLDMERRFAALEQYKTARLAEKADEIMPELRDLVGGTSEEEVDRSIDTAIAKTNAILANVASVQQQQRQQQRGAAVTAPPAGPLENEPTYETLTADDIRNMDMATYAKNRDRLLRAGSPNNRGLFG